MASTARRETGRGRAAGRAALGVALLALVAGCAIPFGPGGEGRPSDPEAGNRIYLEEQERIERSRQGFGNPYPSDR